MPKKPEKKQKLARREPTQDRARAKIELILEAATRIIDKDGLDGLTTNRIAQIAGISIGTVYQYFDGKTSIIRALGQREMRTVTETITSALTARGRGAAPEPARVLVDSVFGAFGGRSKVHRVLLDYALAQGRTSGVDDPPHLVAGLLASGGLRRPDGQTLQLTPAQAFVLTYAFTGVTRASMGPQANDLSREELKDALLFLIRSYVDAMAAAGAGRSAK